MSIPEPEAEDSGSTIFDTAVSDIQDDDIVVDSDSDTITGTLKYLDDGDIADYWGAGNFIALKFPDADLSTTTVKVGMDPTEGSGLVELDNDKNGVFKVTNKDAQKFIIEVIDNTTGEKVTERYDLSGLTCETE